MFPSPPLRKPMVRDGLRVQRKFCALVLICLLAFFGPGETMGSAPACNQYLTWAPKGIRRNVFTTFANHANCPSWTTRNQYTKTPTNRNHLILPRGAPFAFLCGSCFSPSSLQVNLTAELDSKDSLTVVPLKGGEKHSYEHRVNDFTSCYISYGITGPLTTSGTLKCRLNRGSNSRADEKVSFKLRTPRVTESPVQEVQASGDGRVTLQCPETELGNKINMIYVWHYTDEGEGSPAPKVVIPSLDREVHYRPKAPVERVSCSVYDMTHPERLWRASYKILGAEPAKEKVVWGVGGEELEDTSSNWRLTSQAKTGILASIIVGAIFIISIIACVCMGGVPCKKKQRQPLSGDLHPNHSLLSPSSVLYGNDVIRDKLEASSAPFPN